MSIDPVAIYGAVVATGVLLWTIIKDRPQVVVKVEFQGGFDDEEFEVDLMNIFMINKGRRTVYIETVGFTYSNGDTLTFPPEFFKLEKCLQPGTSRHFQIDIPWLRETTHRKPCKFFWVRDVTDKIYKRRLPKDVFN